MKYNKAFTYDWRHWTVQEIKELIEMGIQVGLVIGGGNLFRGKGLAEAGMNRVVGDQMGMLATVMNGLAMRDALHRAFVNTRLMSAIDLAGVCDTYNWAQAISLLKSGRVVIFAAGTGNPYFTTDTTAALRAIEMECDAVAKGTQVDGVYSADPRHNSSAIRYDKLTYDEVLGHNLKVMDATAIALARDNKMPVVVFSLKESGNIAKLLHGEARCTLIS